ncbi:uncharacterized protein FIBRA_02793 [Fibroporia radiculosa]|uniref:Uncharacterized protein n=1 Tax=Fibroporia radiculosa TaxID=599839 RepID=J4G2S7_9APHY|nr:uncharacterized protein FIBRA_02793 [Fibroporia radiculosa]CCM00753.1 predicted protein [Fibroporia radiculosa]
MVVMAKSQASGEKSKTPSSARLPKKLRLCVQDLSRFTAWGQPLHTFTGLQDQLPYSEPVIQATIPENRVAGTSNTPSFGEDHLSYTSLPCHCHLRQTEVEHQKVVASSTDDPWPMDMMTARTCRLTHPPSLQYSIHGDDIFNFAGVSEADMVPCPSPPRLSPQDLPDVSIWHSMEVCERAHDICTAEPIASAGDSSALLLRHVDEPYLPTYPSSLFNECAFQPCSSPQNVPDESIFDLLSIPLTFQDMSPDTPVSGGSLDL